MKNSLSKSFVEGVYYKAFNHHLRNQDSTSIIQLANWINEFINLTQDGGKGLNSVLENIDDENKKIIVTAKEEDHTNHKTDLNVVYHDARGWCWSCWKTKAIQVLEEKLKENERQI